MNAKTRGLFLLLLAGLMAISVVAAQPYGADSVTAGASSTANLSGITAKQVNAQAGNVTQLSINGSAVTTSWQGFYGNVTGQLILADSAGNNFYDWNLSSPLGEVYASRSNAVTWSSINCTDAGNVTAEETTLGQSAADPDSVTNTFAATNHPSFLVGSANMTGCYSTKAYNSAGAQGTGFWQVLLSDNGANTVYTTILDASPETGFNNQAWDFQLLVGENGKVGNEGATPYYFYVELQ
ncbi:MAG: hypothetical protein ACP5N2_06190 [Candidatus Nanoarchaeia archaeon]